METEWTVDKMHVDSVRIVGVLQELMKGGIDKAKYSFDREKIFQHLAKLEKEITKGESTSWEMVVLEIALSVISQNLAKWIVKGFKTGISKAAADSLKVHVEKVGSQAVKASISKAGLYSGYVDAAHTAINNIGTSSDAVTSAIESMLSTTLEATTKKMVSDAKADDGESSTTAGITFSQLLEVEEFLEQIKTEVLGKYFADFRDYVRSLKDEFQIIILWHSLKALEDNQDKGFQQLVIKEYTDIISGYCKGVLFLGQYIIDTEWDFEKPNPGNGRRVWRNIDEWYWPHFEKHFPGMGVYAKEAVYQIKQDVHNKINKEYIQKLEIYLDVFTNDHDILDLSRSLKIVLKSLGSRVVTVIEHSIKETRKVGGPRQEYIYYIMHFHDKELVQTAAVSKWNKIKRNPPQTPPSAIEKNTDVFELSSEKGTLKDFYGKNLAPKYL